MRVPTRSDGHKVGRELDAVERAAEDLASVLTASVFASPGTPSSSRWPRASRRRARARARGPVRRRRASARRAPSRARPTRRRHPYGGGLGLCHARPPRSVGHGPACRRRTSQPAGRFESRSGRLSTRYGWFRRRQSAPVRFGHAASRRPRADGAPRRARARTRRRTGADREARARHLGGHRRALPHLRAPQRRCRPRETAIRLGESAGIPIGRIYRGTQVDVGHRWHLRNVRLVDATNRALRRPPVGSRQRSLLLDRHRQALLSVGRGAGQAPLGDAVSSSSISPIVS